MSEADRYIYQDPAPREVDRRIVKPTSEQLAILDLEPVKGGLALINAIAGAGKTTTLELYAKAYPSARFLYLCFNKSAADEAKAKFPPNTDCRTTHSLAYGQIGYRYTKNKGKGFGREVRAKAIMGPLGIPDVMTAHAVIGTHTNFLQSAHPEIGHQHLPYFARNFAAEEQNLIVDKAKELWRKASDPNDIDVPISHDGYLKLWQIECLRAAQLPAVLSNYDAILIDESQDTNPTFEAILGLILLVGEHAVILVGDERQSIYQWRGAINLMSRLGQAIRAGRIKGEIRLLSESFRFGPRTAAIATQILSVGNHPDQNEQPVIISGRGSDDSNIEGSHCYLARTNAGLVERVLEILRANPGARVHFAATKAPDWDPTFPYKFGFIESVYQHFAGQPHLVTDPEIKRFADWLDILKHARNEADEEAVDRELATAVNFVQKHEQQTPVILRLIKSCSASQSQAIASFSTVHRAKGLEWDRITLLEDFPRLCARPNEDEGDNIHPHQLPDEQELNLIYVAVTRGRYWLNLNADLTRFTHQRQDLLYD
jgi:F-box protein 18 (helicase)